MQKFPSIESYRNAIANARRSHVSYGQPLRVIPYEGTVKLHGTNAGIRIRQDSIMPQSRERVLSITSDNAGFAHFALQNEAHFRQLSWFISNLLGVDAHQLTIFGEWCGGNIQSKVGLNALDKHFVVFNVWNHETETMLDRAWMDTLVAQADTLAWYNGANIHFIYEIPRFEITIDFTQPEQYTEELERLTLEVEEACPWTTYRGATGIGEGIVWVAKGDTGNSRYWFKTKGVKHQGKDESRVKTLSADPVKVGAMRELVLLILPEWRLEQGITVLKERGDEIAQKSTGKYLKWINEDIIKEETNQILANPWTKKELDPYINQRAKDYFFKYLDEQAFTA